MMVAAHSTTRASHRQRRGRCVPALESLIINFKKNIQKSMISDLQLGEIAEAIANKLSIYHKEVLTLSEAAAYLNLSKSYLYKMTMKKEIPYFKPMGKVCYFNKSDLDNWLHQNRISTDEELQQQADSFCMKKGGRR